MKEHDPNQVHVGKRVMVVGGTGRSSGAKHYKGYKGTITKTNSAGAVSVEIDARLQTVVQLDLSDLALLFVPPIIFYALVNFPTLFSRTDDHTMHILKSVEGPKSRQLPSDMVAPPPPPPEICATPMPEPDESGDLSPTWQPSSRLVHWLEDEHLTGIRLKLFQKDDPHKVLEFVEVVGHNAKVRYLFETNLIPLDDLHPVRPTAKNQLVTATSGTMHGVVLKVKLYGPTSCTVRQPGKVLRKKEVDPSVDLSDLVEIYPTFR